jgi:hypothetical protein
MEGTAPLLTVWWEVANPLLPVGTTMEFRELGKNTNLLLPFFST